MTCPCLNCKIRKNFAKEFDIHFWGDDCLYECDKYERYKRYKDNTEMLLDDPINDIIDAS